MENIILRELLLAAKISHPDNVDEHIQRLTLPFIGVSESSHLKMLEYAKSEADIVKTLKLLLQPAPEKPRIFWYIKTG